jgi:hypothetical protein
MRQRATSVPFSKLLIASLVPLVAVIWIGVDGKTEVGIVLIFPCFLRDRILSLVVEETRYVMES